jgi:aminopeptidase N
MRYTWIYFILTGLLVSAACKSHRPTASATPRLEQVRLDSASMNAILDAIQKDRARQDDDTLPYQASVTKSWELQHTILHLDFDYAKAWVYGEADLKLKPYAYAQDSLVIDAKGMEIQELKLRQGRVEYIPKYEYDQKQIVIRLASYAPQDSIIWLHIKYIAKPEEIKTKGSEAIAGDKGLYFINKDRTDPDKPRQIWTQGETETNSCWFPTIDKPNQRMTQEIYIKVQDKNDVSLSNGVLVSSNMNADGTRTDYWKQSLPAAPYLTMIAVGPFNVTKDSWHGKEVSYYLEPKFAPYARLIFGKTPDMIDFFSTRLGVDYAWEKYSQVVVRDYPGGSMENTTATLHWDKLQHDSRAHIDNDFEEYISHELFHQWFGDLVTCESWSNLPMNESFATYGEYLWLEHSKGRMEADMHYTQDREKYFAESGYKQEPLIRFHYEDKDELFDAHTYQKGSCILHMLRNYLGDTVFFRGLKNYLIANKFKPVESHNLRLAMEEASGQDLNWFFNEWVYRGGHPMVNISHAYNAASKTEHVQIDFTSKNNARVVRYKLPVKIDFYFKDSMHSETIWTGTAENARDFYFDAEPLLVNIDADKVMLWEYEYPRSNQELITQLMRAPLFRDKKEAVNQLLKNDVKNDSVQEQEKRIIADYCFSHEFWGVRELGYQVLATMPSAASSYASKVSEMILHEKNSTFRVELLYLLKAMNTGNQILPVLRTCCNDSSYMVMGVALRMLATMDLNAAVAISQANEKLENGMVTQAIITTYTSDSLHDHSEYMVNAVLRSQSYMRSIRLSDLERYIKQADPEIAFKTLKLLNEHRGEVFKNYDGYFFINLRMYFKDKKVKLEELMSRAKFDEEGYKKVSRRLEVYNQILEIIGNG